MSAWSQRRRNGSDRAGLGIRDWGQGFGALHYADDVSLLRGEAISEPWQVAGVGPRNRLKMSASLKPNGAAR